MIRKISLFIFALVLVVFLSFLATGIVSNLPRSSQGEAVQVSFSICVIGAVLLQTVPPLAGAFLFIKSRNLLRYFIYCLLACLLVNNFFYIPGLYKAWSRGW
jgi:hypothetical protein